MLAATGDAGVQVDDVVTWMRQATLGVARAHDASLVHNDLKPGNLFLSANRDCLVGDFGHASLIPVGQVSVAPRGATPETIAPEVASTWGTTAPSASIVSDVYSLGATAFWLLTTRPPVDFTGIPQTARMSVAAANQAPRLRDLAPHVPQSVARAVEKAIARDPADRFATVGEFGTALGSRPAPLRRWTRTNEHAGHIGCWRGERIGASTYVLCVAAGVKAGSCTITTRHLTSNARVANGTRACSARNWPQAVRAVIQSVS